tara:strand:- start:10 stop:693 length:684 start_codon:yes stop_codon:yes gene_type:complete
MRTLIKFVMCLMMFSPVLANDIYVTQSGDTLTLDVLQDGQNNTIGNSTTASTVTGTTSNFNIDQIGDSNVLTFDINGNSYTGTFSTTGNSNNIDFNCDSGGSNSSCATVTASIIWVGSSNDLDIDVGETADATGANITISGASGSDSNVVAATIDGTSVIFTLNVNGDTNNFLVDIDGDGDSAGHTYIHNHTGSIADVDITQSGIYDNMITLTTSGDNHNIDIIQRD